MVETADVKAILQASRAPMGTGAIAMMLGIHWAPVAELLVGLERKGEVAWHGHGWVPAPVLPPGTQRSSDLSGP